MSLVIALLAASAMMFWAFFRFGCTRFGEALSKMMFWQGWSVLSLAMLYITGTLLGLDITENGMRALFKTTMALSSLASTYYSLKLYSEAHSWKLN